MNASLQRRLFVWLSMSIVVAGVLAGALSFVLAYQDANELQDTQLQQVAAVLAVGAVPASPLTFQPRDDEDAETHFVVKLLGPAPAGPDPKLDVALPQALPAGLQSLERSGVRWRAIASVDAQGRRFGVAQRMTVRDEDALSAALLTLLPLVVLVPVLLLIVRIVLRQAFAPMTALSAEVDRLDGGPLTALDERHVPLEALPLLQAVNRMMERLGRVLEQQRRFVSDAAHELRTPVAALVVQAENVRHVALPPDAAERMASLCQGLVRMSALIEQLLDFARVQGAAPLQSQSLELSTMVRHAIEASLPMAQAKGVDLGCPHIEPAWIRGDPLHAYALVRNAVDNAVRYTPGGGSVDVSVSSCTGNVVFVVEDTGPGIAAADLQRVFEPFVRVLGSRESGSGLGLTIARTASQVLGGDIELGRRADRAPGLRFTYRQAAV